MPSAAVTITANGACACPPTGVAGFVPETIRSRSLGPAPTVSTPLMIELPPDPVSVNCMSYNPSAVAGASTSNCVADAASTGAATFAACTAVFACKPSP